MVGTDGSDASLSAVDWAAREAERHGLPLRVVFGSVWEHYERIGPNFSPDRSSEQESALGEEAREADTAIDTAVARAAKEYGDVPVERRVVEGGARHALLTVAHDADLLVVGARRRTLPVGMQLGPVSHAVLHRAPCPVAVVPQQHE